MWWAAVVIADACAVGIYFLWGPARWAAIALGASAVAIYLLWVIVPKPDVLKWAAVVVALGGAAGIYFLWGPARWAAVAVSPVVSAAGIYWLGRIDRKPDFLKWAAVVVALGVCAVGIYLLWGVWDGKPAAAAFTRVGGATRVETALEASRFWLTPPQLIVETQTKASSLMLGAAQCAMAHDAPLLFTSSDPARQRLVDATVNDWRNVEATHPESITVRSRATFDGRSETLPATFQNLPEVITIQNQPDVSRCVANGDPADVAGLSTLEIPNPIIRLPSQVPLRQTLSPVVVFAAAIEPGDPPDVAVGLALAAHMARASGGDVSLVVVPHYLESDLELENQLQSQHEQVTGGVVLGETPTVPEDTRVLLRQLLTSRDRQGVAAQLQDNLGSVGSLIAALLALTGLATASWIAGPIVIEQLERKERERNDGTPAGPTTAGPTAAGPTAAGPTTAGPTTAGPTTAGPTTAGPTTAGPTTAGPTTAGGTPDSLLEKLISKLALVIRGHVTKKSDWLIDFGDKPKVTICLRSGREVTGTIVAQLPRNTRDATAFRIKTASPDPNGGTSSPDASPARPAGKDVSSADASPARPEGKDVSSPDASPARPDKDVSSADASPARPEGKDVLVSVKEIEQIHIIDSGT
jgi:hypothetical protein